MNGTVKFYNAKMGYGFVQGEDDQSYFVHQSNIKMDGFRRLSKNDNVEFVPDKNEKGLIALNVLPKASA